jgi:hypothetical protein
VGPNLKIQKLFWKFQTIFDFSKSRFLNFQIFDYFEKMFFCFKICFDRGKTRCVDPKAVKSRPARRGQVHLELYGNRGFYWSPVITCAIAPDPVPLVRDRALARPKCRRYGFPLGI